MHKKRTLKNLNSLFRLLFDYKPLLLGAILSLITTGITTLYIPIAFQNVIDNGFAQNNNLYVNRSFMALFLLAFILATATACRFYCVSRLGESVSNTIREKFLAHVLYLSPAQIERLKVGDLLSRMMADTALIQQFSGAGLSVAARNSLLFIGGLGMMIYTSPYLMLLSLALLPFVLFPIFTLGRKVRFMSKQVQDQLSFANQKASEFFHALPTLQTYTYEKNTLSIFHSFLETGFGLSLKRIRLRAILTFILIFFIFSGIVGLLWAGSNQIFAGTTSAGTLTRFVLYSIFTAGALASLSEVSTDLQRVAHSWERICEVLALPLQKSQGKSIKSPLDGHIVFHNVSFSYPNSPEKLSLADLSFSVRQGQKVALIGRSGAGKSTLFQLFLRLQEGFTGEILCDDFPLQDYDLHDLRSNIAVVPQEPHIFSSSAFDNISIGNPGASRDEVIAASRKAECHDFIMNLPQGYDTSLGEKGNSLSGGQKQRIAIARAFLKNASIILLDEATSALDSETELLVQKSINHLTEGKTTFIIAHRLSTLTHADKILVLDKGKLIEQGTHSELIAKQGLYAELATLQNI